MQPFRIVTFNIAHGRGLSLYQGLNRTQSIKRNLDRIAKLLHEIDPDVVALQEVDEDSHWNGRINLLEHIRAHAKFPYAVLGATNRRGGKKPLNYGNGLLSKHPIAHWENVPFEKSEIGGKGFLLVELDVGDRRLLPIVNLHLDYKSRTARLAQVSRITEYLNHEYSRRATTWLLPPILCGDLNASARRGEAASSLMDYFSRHGRYLLHPIKSHTFPSPLPSRSLDFIFLPPACRDIHSKVLRVRLSDHCPVQVDFTLPKARTH